MGEFPFESTQILVVGAVARNQEEGNSRWKE